MTKTMRRQRTRSGLKRRVRKNKTMRGGGMFSNIVSSVTPIKIETFRKTGYKFVNYILDKKLKLNKVDLNTESDNIKKEYSIYYKLATDKTIPNYKPNEINVGILKKVFNTAESVVNYPGIEKASGSPTRPLLSSEDFNDVMNKITTKWIDQQEFTTSKQTNQKFVDFGLSFEKFWNEYYFPNIIKINNPDATNSVSMTNDVSEAVGNVAENTSKAVSGMLRRVFSK